MSNNPVTFGDPDGSRTSVRAGETASCGYSEGISNIEDYLADAFDGNARSSGGGRAPFNPQSIGGSDINSNFGNDASGAQFQVAQQVAGQLQAVMRTGSMNGQKVTAAQEIGVMKDGVAYMFNMPEVKIYPNGKTSYDIHKAVQNSLDGLGGESSGGWFGDALTSTEKHFNGSIGTIGAAVQGYNNIGNDVKRAYAYKLSKLTGLKSGQIFQGVKSFANSAGKLVGKLGPAGTLLGGGVIFSELNSNTWDAHTAVNAGLMIGAGVATIFAAPAVLTGIALYGVGDYFFDFSGEIDNAIGRNSGIWQQ